MTCDKTKIMRLKKNLMKPRILSGMELWLDLVANRNHQTFIRFSSYLRMRLQGSETKLTVTLRKSLPPTLRAGPVGPRVLILRTCHVIGSRMNTGLIPYSKRSCNKKSNFYFRFPFPVKAVFKISFPVWADITKMCRIKFQGEPLETFFIYEVVYYPENDDLGVVGPPGPARSVTVKN